MLLIIECNLGYCVFFIECSLGYYGYNCNELYDGCLSDACDSEFGICINTSGCNPGWQPGHEKYDLACVSEQFGDKCTQTCHCINTPYDPIAGTCPPGGCQRGYAGRTCSRKCSTTSCGVNCESRCDTCVNRICDRFDGNCTYGCIEGFKGDRCHLTGAHYEEMVITEEDQPDDLIGQWC